MPESRLIPTKYDSSNPPEPINAKRLERFWKHSLLVDPEPGDTLIPRDGFINDFVVALRGVETSTLFSIWGAIYAVSSILRRDVYFSWYPKPLIANVFVIMCSFPRLVKKTTVIDFVDEVLRLTPCVIKDKITRKRKELNILRGEITPQALHDRLAPESIRIADDSANFVTVDKGSQLAILVSELATMLGTQRYNEGLIEKLTSLFDSREIGDERETKGSGAVALRNIYVTLLGGLTPDNLTKSLPEIALGGGFMSRAVVIFQSKPTRKYPIPVKIPGAPDVYEMARRLAWIAENCSGEYFLNEDAHAAYVDWYDGFMRSLADPVSDADRNRKARMDNLVLKVALLVRAQRYDIGNEIELRDFLLAKELIEATYQLNGESFFSELGNKAEEASPWYKLMQRVAARIERRGRIDRRTLLANMARWANGKALTSILNQLSEMGCIEVYKNGKRATGPSSSTTEEYVFVKALLDEKGIQKQDELSKNENEEKRPAEVESAP